MKNKKNVYVLAIVAMILMLGVGYAVVSQVSLNIVGNASVKSENLKVVYNGVNSSSTSQSATISNVTNPDDTLAATFDVSNMVLNETATIYFEVQNKETDVNATLQNLNITNTQSGFFTVAVSYKAGAGTTGTFTPWTAGSGTQTLNASSIGTIKVDVTLSKTPVSSENSSTTITITYDAVPAAA